MTRIEEGCEVLIIRGGNLPRNAGRSGIAEKLLQPGDTVTLADGRSITYGGKKAAWFVSANGNKLDGMVRLKASGDAAVYEGAGWAIYMESALMSIDDYAPDQWGLIDDQLIIQNLKRGARKQ